MKSGFVYMMASARNGTTYVGSTSNLIQRAREHREGVVEGHTREHGCRLLVWFEVHEDLQEARRREFQIKKWKRLWKLRLIEETNPGWEDLYSTLF